VSFRIFEVSRQQAKEAKEANRLWFVSSRTSRVSHTMGLPSCFLPTPNLYALPEFIDVNVVWPTSLAGGERPGGSSELQTYKE